MSPDALAAMLAFIAGMGEPPGGEEIGVLLWCG
jgi:hypothetical protein